MSVSRILYVAQTAEITTNDGNQFYFPVQSATCDTTIPVEDVLSFGFLGAVSRVQQNVATCRATVKTFLNNLANYTNYATGYESGTSGIYNNTINAAFLSKLTGDALAGNLEVINVYPNGFTMSGIVTRISLDGAVGALATCEMDFAGVGVPYYSGIPTTILGSSPATPTNYITPFSPVTSLSISGTSSSTGLGYAANSLRFTLDIPNDTITCLGNTISGTQNLVSGGFVMVARAPFKATLSVEGAATDPTLIPLNQTYQWGTGIGVSLVNPLIVSRGFNQAVNSAAASFNWVCDDVQAVFH